jgi:23S rRNA U2552 (ribose-2'-O)-methylase RlmE/FtsJ
MGFACPSKSSGPRTRSKFVVKELETKTSGGLLVARLLIHDLGSAPGKTGPARISSF